MSAAEVFALLRDVQRILRQQEAAGMATEEAKAVRSRVIEGMATLAAPR